MLVLLKVFIPPTLSLPTGIVQWVWSAVKPPKTDSAALGGIGGFSVDHAEAVIGASSSTFSIVSLMIVWFIGAITFWLFVLRKYRKLIRHVSNAAVIDEGPLRIALEKVAISLNVKKSPELRVTESFTSPLLFGLLCPSIVLPKSFVDEATPAELSAVLTHELIHLKRRDTWIGWVQVIAQSLFWFHPFIWWANHSLRHEREEACDEMVLRTGNVDRKSYGESMMRVVITAKARSLAEFSTLGVFERDTHLQLRLEKIMNDHLQQLPFGTLSKAFIVIAAFTLLPMSPSELSSTSAQEAESNQSVAARNQLNSKYPQIVDTVPSVGQTDVKISLNELRVTFDRDMSTGMSWTGGPPLFPPTDKTKQARWIDSRTCVLPVKLDRGKYYRLGINSTSYQNFQSKNGTPARPSTIYFATVGASPEIVAKTKKPEIVGMNPENHSKDVSPNTKSISVTFNMPMGSGMSWTGGGEAFPEIPKGTKPTWSKDKRSCTLPVKLQPGHSYRIGINSPSHKNFQSEFGIPVGPTMYEFTVSGRTR